MDEIQIIIQSPLLTDTGKVKKIEELLENHAKEKGKRSEEKMLALEQTLEAVIKNDDYYTVLENLSVSLQRRIADILQVLIFNPDTSDAVLLKAIDDFKERQGDVTLRSPTDFLKKEEKTALLNENKKLRVSLYKVLLFMHVADAIKSGRLNLAYSFRYFSINGYLVDETQWHSQREHLLKIAELSNFSNYTDVMTSLKTRLEQKYQTVNERFTEKRNPYLLKNKKEQFYTITPALEDKDTEYIAALIEQVGYVLLFQILSDIEKISTFTSCFKHLT